ncbi:ferric iron reductase protein FhuF [Prauserella shujinwangii]|uniref:Ferric iron reductase protein FhuF n=1 Tax=Prauserella shujinwangii TaxID=1453103 RepID=A0A2T0LWI1_9PSEU|nr:(2Fe-2S)-binding protein [Prauserella shujinwangii]PRX48382.1 ferric iron reductase protein FhuF [Prauserella shujinwangii]
MTRPVPATVLADESWLREDLDRAARLYGRASGRVLGTIRWYSASSVLVAPALESLVHTGIALDPALESVTLDLHPDGRYVDAHSRRPLGRDVTQLGAALGAALTAAVTAGAAVSGATERSLWAIAADSIANRLLWAASAAGDEERGMRLAEEIGDAVGSRLPRPRFVRVGAKPVVRRASCCLIYEATGGEKCASCPRQTPAERTRRLELLLGS